MVNLKLLDYVSTNGVKFKSPVKTADLVSFRIGGVGNIAVYPNSISQLCDILEIVNNDKFVILGNGSNCYFTDGYYDGIIIVTKNINSVSVCDNVITAECGVAMNNVCKIAKEKSLSGLEFAYGIPGTIGGVIYMNASAYDSSISKVVLKSTVLDISSGKIFEINNKEHKFGTKKSIFKTEKLCLLSTEICLSLGEKSVIDEKMSNLLLKRKKSQPLNLPSAGSVFVKPETDYASRLIDMAGLKGYSVGGAQISQKHAGFIVNLGGASAKDLQALTNYIKDEIYKRFKIELKEEIIYLE